MKQNNLDTVQRNKLACISFHICVLQLIACRSSRIELFFFALVCQCLSTCLSLIRSCSPRDRVHIILSDSYPDPRLIFYHVQPTSRISTPFVTVSLFAVLSSMCGDSFLARCLTRFYRWHKVQKSWFLFIQQPTTYRKYNTSRNGNSGENRPYHRRSQWDRFLHRSWITSKRSESNLISV